MSRNKAFSLKKYGDLYKFTVYSLSDRNSNIIPSEWVDDLPPWPTLQESIQEEVKEHNNNDEKLDNNIIRAKSKIFDYAMSNEWEYFCTFTIDRKKYDRYNLKKWYKDFAKWLNHYNERNNIKLSYLFIPEMHKDGAWHIHGLIMGLPRDKLSFFIPGIHPQYLIDNGYLNWSDYADRFGFCSFALIRQKQAVSAYIMKYIGKGLNGRKDELGAYLYYASKGLKTPDLIKRGIVAERHLYDFIFAFENDYVKTIYLTENEMIENKLIRGLLEDDL